MRLTRRAKRRLLFLLALAVLGTAAAFTWRALQDAQRERVRLAHRADGLKAFADGRMEEALGHLNVAVQYDQDDVEVLLAFAEARSSVPLPNRAHLQEARLYYEHALDLVEADTARPDRAALAQSILIKLLHVRGQLGETLEMERVADRILKDDPNNIEALTAKVTATMRDRRFDEALPIAKKLAELEPGALRWLHLQLEIARSQRALDSELLAQCDAWIDSYDGDGRMNLLKAAWLYELGYVDKAQEEAKSAVAKGASSLEVLRAMLGLLGSFDQHDLIAKVIANTRANYPDAPWAQHAIIEYDWQSGLVGDAIVELDQAKAEQDTLPIDLRRDQVLLMMVANRMDDARTALELFRKDVEAGRGTEKDRALLIALSTRLALAPASWPKMLAQFDEALAIAPDEPVVHFLRGEVCAKVGEHALAVESFGRAASLAPTWIAASTAEAESLLALGRAAKAFDIARTTARRAPRSNLAPLLTMARAALDLNQLRDEHDATPIFQNEAQFAGASAPTAARGIDLAGMLLAVQQQLPANPQVFTLLIESLMQVGRVADAQQQMKTWLAQQPLDEEQLIAAAEVVRRYELASRDLLKQRLREYRGNDPRIAMAHAWLLLDEGNPGAGIDIVNQYFASAPAEIKKSDTAQLARVSFLLSAPSYDAWSNVRELVKQFPNSVPVQTFALGQAPLWEDQATIEAIINNLEGVLGDRSQQVRLARASYLLRFFIATENERARAVVIVQSVLEETPSSLVALTLLADAYLQGDKPMYEQAVDALQSAIDAHPRVVSLYPRFIALLQQLGRYDLAQRYLAQLASLNSGDPKIARAEVELLLTQGSFEAALLRAMTFINAHSPPPDKLLLAAMFDRTGQTAKANDMYEQLLADPAAAPIARTQAAEFFAKQGDFARGFDLLTTALNENDDEGEREVLLGWFCYRHGEGALARTHFERAIAVAPKSADAWHAMDRFHLSESAFAAAEQSARDGMQRVSDDERLLADLALAQAGASGQPWRESLGRLGEQSGDVKALLATLSLASEVASNSGASNDAHATDKQLEQARNLTTQFPRFIPGWYLAIALNANADRLIAATELARSAMTRFPSRPAPAEWASRLFMQNERWNDALSAAEEWVARTADDPIAAQCAVATCMLKLERVGSAFDRLQPYVADILAARNTHPANAMAMVDTFIAAGKVSELVTAAAPMLDERAWRMRWAFSAHTAAPEVTALVLEQLEARATSTDTGTGEPGTPEERIGLAAEWQQLADRTGEKKWLDRAAALAEAVASTADSPSVKSAAQFVLATVDESRGDDPAAEKRYREVLRAQPNHALALNNLAYLLFEQDSRSAEALELARKAAALLPSSADVLDTLGVVLLASGKPAEAESNLRKALEARPNDVPIALNLVDSIIHQERFDDASQELEQVQRKLRWLPGKGAQYEERVQGLRQRIRDQVTVAGST